MATYTITIDERTADGKHILELLQKSEKYVKFAAKEGLSDPSKMSKSEYIKKIKKSIAQAERGEVVELKYEDIDKFLGLE